MSASRDKGWEINVDDFAPGAIFASIGGFFLYQSVFRVSSDPSEAVGPATFSSIVSVCLLALAAVLILRSVSTLRVSAPVGNLRGILPVLVSPILFGVLIRGAGFFPAILVSVFVASLAIPMGSITRRLMIVGAIVASCIVIFHYGLKLPYALFGTWLRW